MQKTVQVAIEIGEEYYKRIMRCKELGVLWGKYEEMIANGTVLPEHGRLIDADELEELFREVISHLAKEQSIHIQGALEHMVRASAMTIEMITDAPTILEAWGNEE